MMYVSDVDPDKNVGRVARRTGDDRVVHTTECVHVKNSTRSVFWMPAAEYLDQYGDHRVCAHCQGLDYNRTRDTQSWDHYRLLKALAEGEKPPDGVAFDGGDT